jgi:hypothetical protein
LDVRREGEGVHLLIPGRAIVVEVFLPYHVFITVLEAVFFLWATDVNEVGGSAEQVPLDRFIVAHRRDALQLGVRGPVRAVGPLDFAPDGVKSVVD